MLLHPGCPRGELRGQQLHINTSERAIDPGREELTPQRVRLVIVHNDRIHDELAGNAESEGLALDLAGKYHAREAEWSPSDRDGYTPDGIVHHLMGTELRGRIRAMVIPDGHTDHAV